jgi:hypothetical protein
MNVYASSPGSKYDYILNANVSRLDIKKMHISIQDKRSYIRPSQHRENAHPPSRMSTVGADSKRQELLSPSLRLQQAITSVWATRQPHLAYKPCHPLHRFASKIGSTNGAEKPLATVGVWKRNITLHC